MAYAWINGSVFGSAGVLFFSCAAPETAGASARKTDTARLADRNGFKLTGSFLESCIIVSL